MQNKTNKQTNKKTTGQHSGGPIILSFTMKKKIIGQSPLDRFLHSQPIIKLSSVTSRL